MSVFNIYGVCESVFSYLEMKELLYISLSNKEYISTFKNCFIDINCNLHRNNDLLTIFEMFPKIETINIKFSNYDGIVIKNAYKIKDQIFNLFKNEILTKEISNITEKLEIFNNIEEFYTSNLIFDKIKYLSNIKVLSLYNCKDIIGCELQCLTKLKGTRKKA